MPGIIQNKNIRTKEKVVVELLDAAVPISITVKMDSVKIL